MLWTLLQMGRPAFMSRRLHHARSLLLQDTVFVVHTMLVISQNVFQGWPTRPGSQVRHQSAATRSASSRGGLTSATFGGSSMKRFWSSIHSRKTAMGSCVRRRRAQQSFTDSKPLACPCQHMTTTTWCASSSAPLQSDLTNRHINRNRCDKCCLTSSRQWQRLRHAWKHF
jgi:hypothetical protein